jgi:uncharacterized protein YukJ
VVNIKISHWSAELTQERRKSWHNNVAVGNKSVKIIVVEIAENCHHVREFLGDLNMTGPYEIQLERGDFGSIVRDKRLPVKKRVIAPTGCIFYPRLISRSSFTRGEK